MKHRFLPAHHFRFRVELHVDDELATIYRGDGIISTLSSTAYNMSAGGQLSENH